MSKKQSAGFTLIELVMVIVILGVLAAVALPRFVELKADAEKSTIEALVGSLATARTLWLTKAATCGSDYVAPGRMALATFVGLSNTQTAICDSPGSVRGHTFDADQIRNGMMQNPSADLFTDNLDNGNQMRFVTKTGRTVTIDHNPSTSGISYTAAPAY